MEYYMADDITPGMPGPGFQPSPDVVSPALAGPGQAAPAGETTPAPGGHVLIFPGPENVVPGVQNIVPEISVGGIVAVIT